MALNEFEGTVMLVSHDRALLRETCDEFWLVADGELKPFDGDLDDYQKWLLERSREAQRAASGKAASRASAPASAHPAPAAAPPAAPAPAPAAQGREDRKAAAQARARLADQTRPLRNEQGQIDKRLEKLGGEKTEVEGLLATPGLSGEQFAEHGRRLAHIQAELAMLEERWLELGEEIEALTRQAG
jgi:ATP-binding cassette subfamily F protein 3